MDEFEAQLVAQTNAALRRQTDEGLQKTLDYASENINRALERSVGMTDPDVINGESYTIGVLMQARGMIYGEQERRRFEKGLKDILENAD